jgi:hypothetical protein
LKLRINGGKLIVRGFSNEDIADITGLSLVVIETLCKEMN